MEPTTEPSWYVEELLDYSGLFRFHFTSVIPPNGACWLAGCRKNLECFYVCYFLNLSPTESCCGLLFPAILKELMKIRLICCSKFERKELFTLRAVQTNSSIHISNWFCLSTR
ncbi:hypothetical protein RRG08_046701 [Elysia crispata]|uniref:Uncharacterized protein n=1 Tax=Elysia crispata TaxID=231223 RepID=A0AAE1ABI9_9GAST|nr:hypothetical protein RRG08_046701 [Elysia crispata]